MTDKFETVLLELIRARRESHVVSLIAGSTSSSDDRLRGGIVALDDVLEMIKNVRRREDRENHGVM